MNTSSALPSDPNRRTVETHTADQTIELGRTIGRRLNQRLVLFLYGDLGSGKTAFAQGLARGLGVPDSIAITSPTYTLVNEYPGRLLFCHVDLYRLSEPVDPDEIGLIEIFDQPGIVAVEWPERLHPSDHPPRRLDFFFSPTGDNSRSIRVIAYGLDLADLLKDIPI
ncbi:tRNA (adenosine(37)-N6)-threonylcarbamoyltransferase complex ATPase subunit type 1 TsaE [Desulfosarcina ovata]|uniref:tRNA threonylcarbamoyladenosine biosynthesis protein TsaE n=1 Tax=Desulfosarcina ovata subsp. ovata TaxID=2752305 RepID=A0A5K8A5R1_9BACT|nr:tRNA (adenosine(37)-N6)-threonylcarbamoyltransferase complex ATPase subunit type 1 TsaE [Desulfosarcina ovata]BBO87837.1 tRNA (adenosine(37)-N6)-threonylcarbamoyltransferase complex ATPase subunit type 1 TsaE [Desulfosarcina ovata subsp. ovata]